MADQSWETLAANLESWDRKSLGRDRFWNRRLRELQQVLCELVNFAAALEKREQSLAERECLNAEMEAALLQAQTHLGPLPTEQLAELASIFCGLQIELERHVEAESLQLELNKLRQLNARLVSESAIARHRAAQLYYVLMLQGNLTRLKNDEAESVPDDPLLQELLEELRSEFELPG